MNVVDNESNTLKSPIGMGIALVVLLAGIILPWVMGGNPAQIRVLSLLIFATVLWSTDALDTSVTSLAVIVLMPILNVIPYAEAVSQLGDSIIWRLMGIFVFTGAVSKSGLGRRLAFHVLKLSRGKVRPFFFLFILVTYLFTFMVPAIMGRTMLMLTMVVGLLSAFEISPPSNIGKSIMASLAFLTIISSTSTMFGSSTTIYTVGLFKGMLGYNFNYTTWLLANFPISFLVTLSAYFVFTRLFPPELELFPGGQELINKSLQEMGPLSLVEKKVLAVFALLLFLWISNWANTLPAELLAALLLMLPKVGMMSWKEASKEVNWGIMILFGAGLTIADALAKTNVISDITKLIVDSIGTFTPFVLAVVVFILTVLVRLGMSNMMAVVATFMPLVLNLGMSVGVNPVWIGLISLFASQAIFLPTQSPSGIVTFAYEYYTTGEMIKAGIVLALVIFGLTLLAAFYYWPLIGIPIYPEG